MLANGEKMTVGVGEVQTRVKLRNIIFDTLHLIIIIIGLVFLMRNKNENIIFNSPDCSVRSNLSQSGMVPTTS